MKTKLLLPLLLIGSLIQAQNNYTGFVAGDSIIFSTDANSFSETALAYYSLGGGYIFPFWMSGYLENGTLKLTEYQDVNVMSTIEIYDFDDQKNELKGNMTFMGSGETFELVLTKSFSLDGNDFDFNDQRLEQLCTSPPFTFSVVLEKNADDYYARITGFLIMDENFDILQEFIDMEGSSIRGYESVQMDDYNFDGILDVSVFNQQYAGANTTGYYFLYNTESEEFEFCEELSNLISAEFDWGNKMVIERNQSGQEVSLAFYAYDSYGKLEQLNMTAEEYEPVGETWDFTKTQEGDFDMVVDQGKVVFLNDGNLYVTFNQIEFLYKLKYEDDQVILTNTQMEEDVLTYTVEVETPDQKIWSRLENDVWETWIMNK